MFQALLNALSDWMLIFALHLSGNSFPKALSAAEERQLFERLKHGDRSAREKLIHHNLRLVAHVVKKYYAGIVDQDDLISIGTIGLIKAVNTYRAEKKVRFSTYASRCIENEVLMVFRSAKKEQGGISLNDSLEAGDDGSPLTVGDTLFQECRFHEELESKETAAEIRRQVAELPARERKIIELRYGLTGRSPMTQNETAALLGISRSYVSRIETHALQQLRDALRTKVIDRI